MKFVNITSKTVHTKYTGFLHPGKVSRGNGECCKLAQILGDIVKACGNKVGIRLDDNEVKLVERLMELDEIGGGFDPNTIPDEIRKDPTGEKRASEAARKAQQKEIDDAKISTQEARRREAFINGEILERKPAGLATMEGEAVDDSKLKSGFEKIMEENARIAAGEKPKADPNEMLDPVGAHMKKEGEQETQVENAEHNAAGKQAEPLKRAVHRDDDGTRSADAVEPLPRVSERAGAMDRSAAEMARKLSIIGPDIDTMVNESVGEKPQEAPKEPEKANKRAKGGRKNAKTRKDAE